MCPQCQTAASTAQASSLPGNSLLGTFSSSFDSLSSHGNDLTCHYDILEVHFHSTARSPASACYSEFKKPSATLLVGGISALHQKRILYCVERWSLAQNPTVALTVCVSTESSTYTTSHTCYRSSGEVWENWGGGLTSFPPNGKHFLSSSVKKRKQLALHFSFLGFGKQRTFLMDAFFSAYLFQVGFSLWGLVSKAAKKQLCHLDCEVGEEGEVPNNVWGDALWNKVHMTGL